MASLPTPAIVRRSIIGPDGAMHGTRMRQFIDLSSSGAVATTEIAAALAPRGIEFLDAPCERRCRRAPARETDRHGLRTPQYLRRAAAAAGGLRPRALRGREAGACADFEAHQQPHVGDGRRHHVRSNGHGRESGPRPQRDVGCHQHLERPQQRHPGQISEARAHARLRLRLFSRAVLQRRPPVPRRGRGTGCSHDGGAVVRQMLSITCNAYGFDTDCTSTARIVEGWGGCEIAAQPGNPGDKR